jgi:hypothetical protein
MSDGPTSTSDDLLSTITTTVTDIQERLSLAYLTAIAAQAGCQVQEFKVDRNGVDATIRPIAGAAIAMDVQMKSVTTDIRIHGGNTLSFQLDTPTYNKLRRTDAQAPQLLVVLEMPKDRQEWLVVTPPLVLRNAAYWYSLRGHPAVDTATTAVHIPSINLFDHKAIVTILKQAHARALEGHTWG